MKQPWAAVFVACNQFPADLDLLRTAILFMKGQPKPAIYPRAYFEKRDYKDRRVLPSTFRTASVTIKLGLKLGSRGVLAYSAAAAACGFEQKTSSRTPLCFIYWADEFVRGMEAVEKEMVEVSPFQAPSVHRKAHQDLA